MGALDAAYIRSMFLRGLTLEDAEGRPLTNDDIENHLQAAKSRFERKYAVRLQPTIIKVGSMSLPGDIQPDPNNPLPVEEYGGIDYHPDQARGDEHFSMKLPVAPMRAVHAAGLWMPGMMNPTPLPTDWIHWAPRSNRIRFYPGRSLNIVVVLQTGVFAQLVSAERPIPHAWHINYTAGYTEDDLEGRDSDVKQALARMAALEVLVPGSIDANLAAGLTGKSVSVDGLSQSLNLIQNANALKYQPLIESLAKGLEEWERTYWARQSGVRLMKL